MIEILKEKETTGKIKFIPSLQNLNAAIDIANEAVMSATEEQDKITAALDTVMMTLADLMEAMDTKGDGTNEQKQN